MELVAFPIAHICAGQDVRTPWIGHGWHLIFDLSGNAQQLSLVFTSVGWLPVRHGMDATATADVTSGGFLSQIL